jgi:hypothetical protein
MCLRLVGEDIWDLLGSIDFWPADSGRKAIKIAMSPGGHHHSRLGHREDVCRRHGSEEGRWWPDKGRRCSHEHGQRQPSLRACESCRLRLARIFSELRTHTHATHWNARKFALQKRDSFSVFSLRYIKDLSTLWLQTICRNSLGSCGAWTN